MGKTIHGMARRRKKKPIEYAVWQGMKQRCLNPNHTAYKYYGGRGIKIHDSWANSYEKFLSDVGNRPSLLHTLDRIDNNGDYMPGNCRWITRRDQCQNRKNNYLITFRGITRSLSDWSEITGIPTHTLRRRVQNKVPTEIILNKHLIPRKKKKKLKIPRTN